MNLHAGPCILSNINHELILHRNLVCLSDYTYNFSNIFAYILPLHLDDLCNQN